MNFLPNDTLAGYARTAVDLRARMADFTSGTIARTYLEAMFEGMPAEYGTMTPDVLTAMHTITGSPWRTGEPYIVAPAMTAIIAAAAQALDLSGEVLPDDVAPDDQGVVFFPDPLYHRGHTGKVSSIGAITWARITSTSGQSSWIVAGWADQHDPHDPSVARRRADLAARPDIARQLGPYLLSNYTEIPIGRPVEHPEHPVIDDAVHDWEPAPDGRFCIDEATARTRGCTAIAYAFWRIQAQPLATVAAAAMDRPSRRRAERHGIKHDTRVVMLRRTSPLAEPGDGDPKWHYRVRFVVRGHWRRLTDRDGNPYRIWINAHIKGPDGAPLLHGEKVAVLAR
ncbi:hypothetical protein OHA21_38345 [Actinoplanes sp. NBC_00393]|uniref:hypothetical protein n=1 Tax=Actinoplanes sp. NBC_00393 TaxID=2975953 RepID=UPI002E213430